ncbi:MAG: DUF2970 domain-containing protein [Pseudomonadota bacterium]
MSHPNETSAAPADNATTAAEPSGVDAASADGDASDKPNQGLGIGAVLSSTIAAAVGVQSSRNRRRDFEQGRARDYIIAGIGFTIVFVLTMIFIVRTVLGGL